MALINKLKAIGDGFRTSRGTTQEYSLDEMAVLAAESVGGSAVIEPLSVTANGTYTPPEGVDGYSPVTVSVAGGGDNKTEIASLEVRKIISDTHDGFNSRSYSGEQFILLGIIPRPYGTVKVTYGSLTKTIRDISGYPSKAKVFFGTYLGETDDVETPEIGTLTIEGEYTVYGPGEFNVDKSTTTYCSCITAVNDWGSIEFIPEAFYANRTDLTSVIIKDGTKAIGDSAFFECTNLMGIVIPESVTVIGAFAFGLSSGGARTVTMMPKVPPIINDTMSGDTPMPFHMLGTNNIIVPAGCAEAYKSAPYWSEYADYITEAEV